MKKKTFWTWTEDDEIVPDDLMQVWEIKQFCVEAAKHNALGKPKILKVTVEHVR